MNKPVKRLEQAKTLLDLGLQYSASPLINPEVLQRLKDKRDEVIARLLQYQQEIEIATALETLRTALKQKDWGLLPSLAFQIPANLRESAAVQELRQKIKAAYEENLHRGDLVEAASLDQAYQELRPGEEEQDRQPLTALVELAITQQRWMDLLAIVGRNAARLRSNQSACQQIAEAFEQQRKSPVYLAAYYLVQALSILGHQQSIEAGDKLLDEKFLQQQDEIAQVDQRIRAQSDNQVNWEEAAQQREVRIKELERQLKHTQNEKESLEKRAALVESDNLRVRYAPERFDLPGPFYLKEYPLPGYQFWDLPPVALEIGPSQGGWSFRKISTQEDQPLELVVFGQEIVRLELKVNGERQNLRYTIERDGQVAICIPSKSDAPLIVGRSYQVEWCVRHSQSGAFSKGPVLALPDIYIIPAACQVYLTGMGDGIYDVLGYGFGQEKLYLRIRLKPKSGEILAQRFYVWCPADRAFDQLYRRKISPEDLVKYAIQPTQTLYTFDSYRKKQDRLPDSAEEI